MNQIPLPTAPESGADRPVERAELERISPGSRRRTRARSAQEKPAERNIWHQLHGDEVLRLLEVDPRVGLSSEEVRKRQERFGLNQLSSPPTVSAWLRFLRQVHQPLVYLLLIAVVVTAALGEWIDSCVIFGVVIINAIVGFVNRKQKRPTRSKLSRV